MATAAENSAESKALRLAFSYLVNSIDLNSVLPAALNAGLISESQRSDFVSVADPVGNFLGHLQRAINVDSNKYHTFVQVLEETRQFMLAQCLQG